MRNVPAPLAARAYDIAQKPCNVWTTSKTTNKLGKLYLTITLELVSAYQYIGVFYCEVFASRLISLRANICTVSTPIAPFYFVLSQFLDEVNGGNAGHSRVQCVKMLHQSVHRLLKVN